ncbi:MULTISPECIES: hypothetical protein [Streptomyces]|uniref:hypothetical protein n=1 Tax=Streptomyces TaxID=1883 RepID=UPI001D0592F8|nr:MULTISPECIES: hypothetical protein [Streptomyces]
MMRRTSSTAVARAAVAAAVAFAVLTACSSDSSDAEDGAGSSESSESPAEKGEDAGGGSGGDEPTAEEETATPPPTPDGPCGDGSCEIEVTAGDVVNVPPDYGLGPIEVTAITEDGVELAAPLTGSGFGVAGCSGGGGVSTAGGSGIGLRCGVGPPATINDVMSLEVVEVDGASAVLRIEPAG